MIDLKNIKEVYFIGIGGIGMSALARYFRKKNKTVSGFDRTESTLTHELQKEGINVHYKESPKLKGKPDLIIYTPAIPEDSIELAAARKSGVLLLKRAEVLQEITKNDEVIAIAGTHGKTTISTLLAHLLHQSNVGCNAFLGGISSNYNTNFLSSDKKSPCVLEADEFDRSFLKLKPHIALISSVDADHLDIYENEANMLEAFRDFTRLIDEDGVCFMHYALKGKIKPGGRSFTYSLANAGSFRAKNIELVDGMYQFDLHTNTVPVEGLRLRMPGLHNVENAVAASAIAIEVGITELELRRGLESFEGIKRRFEIVSESAEHVYIDDYAHHPREIEVALNSAREMYPNKKLTCIFQPHLYSRTRDHMEAFARVLETVDELILLDIYPAREKPIEGITSSSILEKVSLNNKRLMSKEACVQTIELHKPELLLSLGAGDISEIVQDLKHVLEH